MPAPALVLPDPPLAEAAAIQRYWEQHHQELIQKYPEMFVAVKDGKVVAANSDLALLVYDLRDRGLDPRADVAIEYISEKASTLLL